MEFITSMAKSQGIISNEKGVASYNSDGVKSLKEGYEGSKMLALYNRMIGSRSKSKGISRNDLIKLFNECYNDILQIEDKETKYDNLVNLIVLVFETRDIKDGKGERDLFYWLFLRLFEDFPATCINTICLITGGVDEVMDICIEDEPIGSFKDLNRLCEIISTERSDKFKELEESIINHYVYNLTRDVHEDNISLSGKWAPRENKETDKKCKLAKKLSKIIFCDDEVQTQLRKYRKLISSLNKRLNTPEVKMCESNSSWGELEVKHFASRAFAKYKKALLDIDKQGNRRNIGDFYREKVRNKILDEFEKIKTNPSESRLNVSKLQPHEIVRQIMNSNYLSEDEVNALNVMFEKFVFDFKNELQDEFVPGIPLCDVSCSMSGIPMEVCIALGIVISMINPAPYKDKVLLFTDDASWHDLSYCKTLVEKVKNLQKAKWGGSTNFAAAINNILNISVSNNVPQDSYPKMLYVFSDMMFNQSEGNNYYNNYSMYSRQSCCPFKGRFKSNKDELKIAHDKAGYKMPTICYWNLRDTGDSNVAKSDEENVICMSGFSSNLFKHFLSGDFDYKITPFLKLQEVLQNTRYEPIRQICDICKEVDEKL